MIYWALGSFFLFSFLSANKNKIVNSFSKDSLKVLDDNDIKNFSDKLQTKKKQENISDEIYWGDAK